nr:tetratricopeptide repeat protein [Lachnospiraceae bacterium]
TGSRWYGREETERLPRSGEADVTEKLSGGQSARYSADGTEILSYGREETERLPGSGAAGVTENLSGSAGRTDERRQNRGEGTASDGTQRFRLNSGIVINKRSDVYSCGATLYYLYTGEIFDTDRDNLLRSGTSEGFIYVLNRALQRDPARRFADGGQMRRALDRLHKNNRSYRRMMLGQAIVKILLVALILIGVGLIISGRDHWKKEMEQEYTTYIVDLNEYRRENDEDSFEDTFEAATGLFPDRIDAWYQKALYLYEQGKFETTADFIEKEIPMDEAIYSKEKDKDETESEKDSITVANLYSILGNAYFELGDYKKCENSLATAISYDDRNPEFYVTRAIALARLGDTEKAESLLEKAINLGVSDDNLNLARGEIAYARGNYAEAEQQLRQCTEETTDDYRLLRAAMRCAEAVNAQKPAGEADEAGRQAVREMTERSAGVLKDAAERLPKQYHRMILHQLSFQYTDAYARLDEAEYAAAAVDVLKRIDEEGFAGFETYCTMVNLYTALERYDEERELLDRMDKEYPDHHLIPLYYAMLTAKLESLKPSEEQDYSLFLEYYNEAERRIAELDPALRSSNEINGLESTYEELVAKGRL